MKQFRSFFWVIFILPNKVSVWWQPLPELFLGLSLSDWLDFNFTDWGNIWWWCPHQNCNVQTIKWTSSSGGTGTFGSRREPSTKTYQAMSRRARCRGRASTRIDVGSLRGLGMGFKLTAWKILVLALPCILHVCSLIHKFLLRVHAYFQMYRFHRKNLSTL